MVGDIVGTHLHRVVVVDEIRRDEAWADVGKGDVEALAAGKLRESLKIGPLEAFCGGV